MVEATGECQVERGGSTTVDAAKLKQAVDRLQKGTDVTIMIDDAKRDLIMKAGRSRVVFRTPNWEDFVHMTFREIRGCSAHQVQIARRLRAMIENLLQTLPQHRHPALREELELLDRALKRADLLPEDLALARIPDSQGLGGSSGLTQPATS